jgi:glycosyltransferase involved in cell wall biosynthesis
LKQKVLIICHHYPDRSPGQRYRFEQYLEFLSENGYEMHMSYLLNEKDDKLFYAKGKYFSKIWILLKSIAKRFKDVRRARNYDLIFIYREAFFIGTTIFERRLSKIKPTIFDFDDAIWLQNVSEANRKFVFLKNPQKTSKIIQHASLVLAGNDFLANYALQFNGNVHVVPTTVDTENFIRKTEPNLLEKICIGWSGSSTTIQHFEYAIPVLTKLKEKYGDDIDIKVMGDASYHNELLNIKGIPWSSDTEVAVIDSFDIGIMPLPDEMWTKGKCGLKGLTYMSLEVPTIMSPVGVNTEIIQDGVNGFLAATAEEWLAKIELLIQDKDLRVKMGKAGRQTVVEKYSVEAWKGVYLKLFQSLTNEKKLHL